MTPENIMFLGVESVAMGVAISILFYQTTLYELLLLSLGLFLWGFISYFLLYEIPE